MKLEIYEEQEVEKDETIRLTLIESMGSIDLIIVNREGQRLRDAAILTINDDGTMKRLQNLSQSHGFQLDEEGRIKMEEKKS